VKKVSSTAVLTGKFKTSKNEIDQLFTQLDIGSIILRFQLALHFQRKTTLD